MGARQLLSYVRSRQSKVQLPLTTACAMLQRGKAGEGRQSSSEDEEVAEVPKTKMDVILGVGGQSNDESRVVWILVGSVRVDDD